MPVTDQPTLRLRRATVADAAPLAAFASAAFVDTFAPDNRPEDIAAYIASAYGEAQQRDELTDARLTIYVAERGGELAGFATLREGGAPDCVRDRDSIEIARLYAGKRWIGSGVGASLMTACLAEAERRGRSTIWLGVWEHNARAITFYRRWGFTDLGSQRFLLGSDLQTDRVMARAVVGP